MLEMERLLKVIAMILKKVKKTMAMIVMMAALELNVLHQRSGRSLAVEF